MRSVRGWLVRLAGLFHKERRDKELAAEIEAHLQIHADENLRAGMSPEEAKRNALMKLGGVEQTKENYRDRRGLPLLETIFQDVRYVLRVLGKSPAFTVVAVLTLALGIGANAATFSVVYSVLLRPLAFTNPDRLVLITNSARLLGLEKAPVSIGEYLDYGGQKEVFDAATVYSSLNATLTGSGEPAQLAGLRVSASFLGTLGFSPAAGRDLAADDEQPGNGNVVLLTRGLWMQRFGGSLDILGQTVVLGDVRYRVVGMLPADFSLPFRPVEPTFLIPITTTPQAIADRGSRGFRLVARLRPGVTVQQAQSRMNELARTLEKNYPDLYANAGFGIDLYPLFNYMVGNVQPALLILFGSVLVVLLIAACNVANLFLVRASRKKQEIAIRVALGAPRSRIMRQLLTESFIVAALGGSLGVFLAGWGIRLLLAFGPQNIPRFQQTGMSLAVLGFTAGIALLSGFLLGILSGLQVSKSPFESLKEGGRSSSGNGPVAHRSRRFLVVGELVAATVLLVAAGLLLRSFEQLKAVAPGFNPRNVLTMQIILPKTRYGNLPSTLSFYRQAQEELQALPGVQEAALTSDLPLQGAGDRSYEIEGQPLKPPPDDDICLVSANYFRSMQIPVLMGRSFDDSDQNGSPEVAIISKSLANKYWPNGSPVGRRLRFSGQSPWRTVVGVVGDTKNYGLDEESKPELFLPYTQPPFPGWSAFPLAAALRTHGQPSALSSGALGAIRRIDKDMAVSDVFSMEQLMEKSLSERRFSMFLLGLFSLLALVLATIGIYGVISSSVTERTHEIGIRMALGASTGNVLKMVLAEGARLLALGLGLGIVSALLLTRMMTSILFGVPSTDVITYAGVALLLGGVTLLASFIPAGHAAKVDPMVSLRYE